MIARLVESVRVVFRYYRNLRFVWLDCLLASQYLLKSPYRISKQFLKKRGESNIYAYGQTPLSTLDRIAKECRLFSKDVVYDFGCGTGRTTLWLTTFVRCRAIGIDFLPAFIKKAQKVQRVGKAHRVAFRAEDFLETDLKDATAIYLYGTCLEDEMIHKLIQRFMSLPRGTKVITVTYPLTDYSDGFSVDKKFKGRFPWGKTDIYLNVRN